MKKQLILSSSLISLLNKQATAFFIIIATLINSGSGFAQVKQENDEAFKKILTERSAKIVDGLEITKEGKRSKITVIISSHYYQLNKIHDNSSKSPEDKTAELESLHTKFISKLNNKLSAVQVEKVKNGMTYNVLNVTYIAYQDMIPTLTEEQKVKIYTWLVEAREKAMMEGSSDSKHKMFGKYKGKINNYLSAQGYNMKAEEKAWQQRLKERRANEAAKKSQGA